MPLLVPIDPSDSAMVIYVLLFFHGCKYNYVCTCFEVIVCNPWRYARHSCLSPTVPWFPFRSKEASVRVRLATEMFLPVTRPRWSLFCWMWADIKLYWIGSVPVCLPLFIQEGLWGAPPEFSQKLVAHCPPQYCNCTGSPNATPLGALIYDEPIKSCSPKRAVSLNLTYSITFFCAAWLLTLASLISALYIRGNQKHSYISMMYGLHFLSLSWYRHTVWDVRAIWRWYAEHEM